MDTYEQALNNFKAVNELLSQRREQEKEKRRLELEMSRLEERSRRLERKEKELDVKVRAAARQKAKEEKKKQSKNAKGSTTPALQSAGMRARKDVAKKLPNAEVAAHSGCG